MSEPFHFQFFDQFKLAKEAGLIPVRATPEELEASARQQLENGQSVVTNLRQLISLLITDHRPAEAMKHAAQLLAMARETESRVDALRMLGQVMEAHGEFEAAVCFYQEAIATGPTDLFDHYFCWNNLGYSLVQLGRFEEAEKACRQAIAVNRNRSNGFKNLGLALQGQERYGEAAESFVQAIQADAADYRPLHLLQQLLIRRPELMPEFEEKLHRCEAVCRYVARHLEMARQETMKKAVPLPNKEG
jgi:tetratricopeptide (TPR) repeat protein